MYMKWGRLFAIHQQDAKRLPAALVEQKSGSISGAAKETNTDTRLMNNVCDRIRTELQQSFERIVRRSFSPHRTSHV
jgi:hypothetical protein